MKTFRTGGVKLHDCKLTAGQAIVELELPRKATLPLAQHIGAPAKCVVVKGQHVVRGEVIAEAAGYVSANVHTPISGVVKSIGPVADGMGFVKQAVTIEASEEDHAADMERKVERLRSDAEMDALTAGEIKAIVSGAGIVGLGGATFPAGVKLSPPATANVDTLIVNAVECEPYLTCDHALMLSASEQIVRGALLGMRACGASRVFIGIEENKPDAIELLRQACCGHPEMQVVTLKEKYPQGGEKQLIYAITHREVPSGKLPADAGVVVQNVATVYAVYRAVAYGEPLMERVVTVTGPEIPRPSNYRVAIGYSLEELARLSGIDEVSVSKAILGGPMMGRAAVRIDVPVEKGTSGLLLLSESEVRRQPVEPCVRCAKCVDACPMGLEPYLLSTLSRLDRVEDALENSLLDCIECGSCSYACPSNRPVLDFIRFGKGVAREMKKK